MAPSARLTSTSATSIASEAFANAELHVVGYACGFMTEIVNHRLHFDSYEEFVFDNQNGGRHGKLSKVK